jgi:hypothetical protein
MRDRQISDAQAYDALHDAARGIEGLHAESLAGQTALAAAVQALDLLGMALIAAEKDEDQSTTL